MTHTHTHTTATTKTPRKRGSFALIARGTLFAFLVAGCVMSLPGPRVVVHAAFPGANGKIAFTSVRDGNSEIYGMNADGTGQTNLTNNPASDGGATWSPDGTKIVFHSDRSGDSDIYVMNADGSAVTNLTNNSAGDYSPSWSPDGTKILFSSNRAGTFDIYVMNADGSGVTQLTNDSSSEFGARWSPDGARIAFWGNLDHDDKWDIYVMNADGTGAIQLSPANGVDDYDPSWSPDSARITFWSGPSGNPNDVYTINPDGSGLTNLTSNPADDTAPEYSPDGSQIAFDSNRNGAYAICLMASTGGSVTCITTNSDGNNFAPSWQPAPLSNQAPIAKAKGVTVPAGPTCSANASVDDGSYDPDGESVALTQSPPGPYSLGTTSVLLTATDTHGASDQATGSVTVVDSTGPGMTGVAATPSSLWPPNHKMIGVTVYFGVTDNCGTVSCVLSVSSNEPIDGLGDGDTAPDWEITDAHHVRLRAERSGTGLGRAYTISITCTDAAGNQTVRTVTVIVPKSH